jgi:Arc/MetJ-type ribon-helix-helix transcriptional regulator
MPTPNPPSIKRINATLPEPLAQFVAQMTGETGLYETPSEFIRDLIRRQMEKTVNEEQHVLHTLLRQSLAEGSYTPLTAQDAATIRQNLQ